MAVSSAPAGKKSGGGPKDLRKAASLRESSGYSGSEELFLPALGREAVSDPGLGPEPARALGSSSSLRRRPPTWTRSVSFVTPAVVPQTDGQQLTVGPDGAGLLQEASRGARTRSASDAPASPPCARSAPRGRPRRRPNASVRSSGLASPPPQERPGARQELGHAEGLRDVVVGALVEQADLLALLVAHGEHEDGKLRSLANLLDELEPVHAGHREVRHDEVELALLRSARALPARRSSRRPRAPRARARRARPCGWRARRRRRGSGSRGDPRKRDLEEGPAALSLVRAAAGRR